MRLLTTAAALAALAPFALPSEADALPLIDYVKVGVSQASAGVDGISFEADGFGYGVAAGAEAGPFRLEAGYDRLNLDAAGLVEGDADYYSVSVNLDLPLSDNVSIFGGGGGGYVTQAGELPWGGEVSSVNRTDWHYQAGLAWEFADGALEFSYRHIQDLDADQIGVALRFRT